MSTVVSSWGRVRWQDGVGAEPWAALPGHHKAPGLQIWAQKLPSQCCRCLAMAWQCFCPSEGDPPLPRDAFAHHVALSWQGSLEGGKEPTNSLLSPRAHQEASNPCHNLVLQQKAPPEDLHSQSLSWGMEVSTCCCLALHFPVKSTSGVQP